MRADPQAGNIIRIDPDLVGALDLINYDIGLDVMRRRPAEHIAWLRVKRCDNLRRGLDVLDADLQPPGDFRQPVVA